ncbi:MAG TPA: hypothetical protein VEI57_05760 [Nitrospirota bacterium]|nr:hypothetical protein [Nitrospirota bacterium]
MTVYYNQMELPQYRRLRDTAYRVAATLPKPAFYERFEKDIRRADEALATHDLVKKCRSYLDESQMECAHGLFHCEAVARDAGALILIEMKEGGATWEETDPLFTAAIIAGLLHDIKRKEQDHAVRGSIEAEKILSALGMSLKERQYIADAIRNHEAFQETFDRDDDAGRLVSDALYDADKFRWGPENFTTTLWLMVETHNTPLASLHKTFREKMKGIEKIKETFRTLTGKQFGPEFIDMGLSIGNAIYEEMNSILELSC